MCVRPVVGVNGDLGTVRYEVVLVINDVDASVVGCVGTNNDTVFLVAGDGAETGSFCLDAAI